MDICSGVRVAQVIIGLENQFAIFLREAVLHRFYCTAFYAASESSVLHVNEIMPLNWPESEYKNPS